MRKAARKGGRRGVEIHGIILAAGLGERFGSHANKLAAPLSGKALLAWGVDAALRSPLWSVHLILGYQATSVLAAIRGPRLLHGRLVWHWNPEYRTGRASSVRCGLAVLPKSATHALFLPGDVPGVTAGLIGRLCRAAREHPSAPICFPLLPDGSKGHPVIYARSMFPALEAIGGDESGYSLIQRNWSAACKLPLRDDRTQMNVNTVGDLRKVGRALSRG
ncbi:MAG: nucleotidyltransferase family protein [Planctomycetes bacterium]|nr:nucleotidyltransferase family protein [Planctomycetota bacterium]